MLYVESFLGLGLKGVPEVSWIVFFFRMVCWLFGRWIVKLLVTVSFQIIVPYGSRVITIIKGLRLLNFSRVGLIMMIYIPLWNSLGWRPRLVGRRCSVSRRN